MTDDVGDVTNEFFIEFGLFLPLMVGLKFYFYC